MVELGRAGDGAGVVVVVGVGVGVHVGVLGRVLVLIIVAAAGVVVMMVLVVVTMLGEIADNDNCLYLTAICSQTGTRKRWNTSIRSSGGPKWQRKTVG